MSGKSIRIFLVDGQPTGLLCAEIGQWNGKALVCPRQGIAKLAARAEAKRPGVYVLVGTDPQHAARERIYIGEAENVYERFKQHDKDEDKAFWSRACVFSGSDENLTKAHIKYLESRLISMARSAQRSAVHNDNNPSLPSLPEGDIADMETYLEQVQVLLPVLGLLFVQPVMAAATAKAAATEHSAVFILRAKGAEATALVAPDAFVVRKGSTASRKDTPSWTTYKSQRDELVAQGLLVAHATNPDLWLFVADVPFASPSAAAVVICARSANGQEAWKTSQGLSYGTWKAEQDAAAESGTAAAGKAT